MSLQEKKRPDIQAYSKAAIINKYLWTENLHSGPFATTITNNKISCSVFHYHNFSRVPQTSFFFAGRSKHVAKIAIFIKYLQTNKFTRI